jgi:hypothetical protein
MWYELKRVAATPQQSIDYCLLQRAESAMDNQKRKSTRQAKEETVLSPAIESPYRYSSVAYMQVSLTAAGSVFQVNSRRACGVVLWSAPFR